MHFGLYLKNKGVITAEQLVDALEVQFNTLVPIGQLALEEMMLTAREIFEILRAQSDSPNERFGDLAIEMGLLTRDDVMRLLMIQADRKRPLSGILAAQGTLNEGQLAAELAAYRQSMLQPQRNIATTRVTPAPRRREIARRVSDAAAAV